MSAKRTNLLSLNANKWTLMRSLAARTVAGVRRSGLKCAARLGAHATFIRHQATQRLDMLRSILASAKVAVIGFSAALPLHEAPVRTRRDAVVAVAPKRVRIEDHWQRAIDVLTAAVASVQRIKSLHVAAARQLDSADYALNQLLQDLRPAMALPTDVSGLRAILAEAERMTPRVRRGALAAA